MHECTSIIINSFHLFQQTLFNKTIFFEIAPWKPMPIMGHAPLKNKAPPSTEEQPPPPYWNMKYSSMKWILEKAQ